ncbi:MAG TPA: hypothetical protein CFH84_05045 [Sulfurimonas sp. UBA12504]|nr:MAG: hypothetical protein A2019_05380 [Sulfurimonas sp. GWF2_37_8]DAB30286.1 MAG TPA: hypothetical protein CFH84_05045 [Sulfurimonas sp. UBA12504]
MYSKHDKLLAEFSLCLHEKRYYDAHEALEVLWFPRRFEDDAQVYLLKGFINASVSFELIKRGRYEPSKRAWKNYLKYRQLLYKVPSVHANTYHAISRHLDTLYNLKQI